MRIPAVDEIVEIECNGKHITAAVEAVEPDPESPLYRQIVLHIIRASELPQSGEQCYWLVDGEKVPAYLQGQVYTQGETTKFRLRAIADANH